jgi:hypothetical protein
MRLRTLMPVLFLVAALPAIAGGPQLYQRIDFMPKLSDHWQFLLGLNDRGQVLAIDCSNSACELFLWSERDGKRIIATGGGYGGFLTNNGEVLRNNTDGGSNRVEIWTEQTGWRTVPGMLSAITFNDSGMIFGDHESLGRGLWTPGKGFFPFTQPPNGQAGIRNMNEDGVAVGTGRFEPCSGYPCYEHAIGWSPAAGVFDLGLLPGLPAAQGTVINRNGSMAGLLYDSTYSLTRHLFLWTPHDGMQEIGACYGCTSPMAINRNDQVAGNIYSFAIRTWFWSRQTGWFDIGSLGGRGARMSSMNDRGEIVGESADSHEVWHAYFWSPKDGFVDLTPNDWGVGTAINNDGLIMGWSINGACVWKRVSGH